MPVKNNKKTMTLWERLQPRMKPIFFAAEAAPTESTVSQSYRGHGPLRSMGFSTSVVEKLFVSFVVVLMGCRVWQGAPDHLALSLRFLVFYHNKSRVRGYLSRPKPHINQGMAFYPCCDGGQCPPYK